MFEDLSKIKNTFEEGFRKIDELIRNLQRVRDELEGELTRRIEQFQLTDYNIDELNKFLEEPYCVLPKRKDTYWVIVPKFINFQVGWLEHETRSYYIYAVNRYIQWITHVPAQLKQKLKFPEPPPYRVVDGLLLTGKKYQDEAWKRYREFLLRREGEDRIRIKKGYEFQLIAKLVEDGILPFIPQPVVEEDLRDYNKIKLRSYQQKAWRKFLGKGAIGVFWSFGCFDDETEILTELGWKRWYEIDFNDKIATLNPKTFELEYHRPERIINYWYEGKMFKLETKQVSLLVTPDHNLFVAKVNGQGEKVWRICKPEDIFNKKCYFKKNAYWKGKKADYFVLPALEIDRVKYKYTQPEKKIPIKEWLKFYGIWLADGCTSKDRKNYKVEVRSTDPGLLEELKTLLNKWGFNARISKDGKIVVLDKQLYTYLSKFGKAENKFIDSKIKQLSPDLLNTFLIYYLKGDGEKRGDVWRASTVSKKLVDDLQEIALKCGYSANYKIIRMSGEIGKTKRADTWVNAPLNTTLYRVTIIRRQNEPIIYPYKNRNYKNKRAKVDWIEYKGIVWDVTVPNHIIYVRRDGKAYWSGNSGKSLFGVYTLARIKGKKLVVVPTLTLKEQWEERIQEYIPLYKDEITIATYHSYNKIKNGSYSLVIFDEVHHLPASTFIRLSTLKRKYTIGLSGSPFREDGREPYIFALTGFPVGLSWDELLKLRIVKKPTFKLYIVKNEELKIRRLRELLRIPLKTIIFCDSIDLGKRIAEKFALPFVYGETKDRLEIIRQSQQCVVSRVGDEGLSLPDIERVIEVAFLAGSRMQESQRFGRLMHASKEEPEHIIIMTEEEFEKYNKRLHAITERGFRIEVVR